MFDKFKAKKPNNIDTKIGLFAWAMQIVGMLFVHIFVLAIFGILTGFVVVGAYDTKFWLMILLAIACVGVCIVGVAAIVIDVCNIIYLFQEFKKLRK